MYTNVRILGYIQYMYNVHCNIPDAGKNEHTYKNLNMLGYIHILCQIFSVNMEPDCHLGVNFYQRRCIKGHIIQDSPRQPTIFHLFSVIKNEYCEKFKILSIFFNKIFDILYGINLLYADKFSSILVY